MKLCVAGLGAIGTYVAARLAAGGHPTSVLARERSAGILRRDGITLLEASGAVNKAAPDVHVAGNSPAEPQDWLIVCAKAYDVETVIRDASGLIGPDTRIVFVQNGIPWWYAAGHRELVSRDRVVACVTYANVRTLGTGHAQHVADDRFLLGQPQGAEAGDLGTLIAAMKRGRIDARHALTIEKEIWIKLWGNLAFNPISALTGATMDRIIAEPGTRPLVIAMMGEAQAIAGALGIDFGMSIAQRLEIASRAGAFKTSMLQDLEAGRRLEVDAIIGAVAGMGHAAGIATPAIDAVLGLLTQKIGTIAQVAR